ncbi:HEAT repeat domain-containing protein [Halomicronema sp. CCY15110]|uniref:HEAT repeat domain-containing protein n=1 Tax=Halomicronema sp. CCY15110 TaxID=2767773 RepID=UPI00194DFCDB|nr:HEAT repeat domain-containing protein [Halomicronema sp. CCY15110]
MGFVIGLIVGLLAGGTITYFLTSKQAVRQAAMVQDLQRQLDLSESEHERRLREATEQLRQDYAAPAVAPPPAVNRPPAQSAPLPAPKPTAPLATSPRQAETPVTATAPSPMPQAVMQSPAVPEDKESAASSPATTPDAPCITDPNALLAASYAPEAATRHQVAIAIAQILPQAGVQAQARWLPVLGRLTRDADATVRLAAIQALASVNPAKRLPWLRRALKDTDPAVVAAANALISPTKGRSARSQPSKKRRLPKNQ